jgi:hypothetical protein
VIAHAGGLPLEETIAMLAPAVAGATLAAGLLIERARSWLCSLDPRDGNHSQPLAVDEGDQFGSSPGQHTT